MSKLACQIYIIFTITIFSQISKNALCQSSPKPPASPIIDYEALYDTQTYNGAILSSPEKIAGEKALSLLQSGGNAIDAAVCLGFTLAVTLPRAGNLGGGGFMLISLAEKKQVIAIDYRETAPSYATSSMFLDKAGAVDKNKSRYSAHAVGIPGTVHGLISAHAKYGKLPFEKVIGPAIQLAKQGFVVYENLENELHLRKDRLLQDPEASAIFFDSQKKPIAEGKILKQPDLAKVLEIIRDKGIKGFYESSTAQKIVSFLNKSGGGHTLADFKGYTSIERKPITGKYLGKHIYAMPPPSSGGVHLIQILNIMNNFEFQGADHNSSKYIHYSVEAFKQAYADRSKYLGDPDFNVIPVSFLTSESYAKEVATKILPDRATPSSAIHPVPQKQINESTETTHFSVMDNEGNAVSNTYTINFSFGAGIIPPETGIFLNNEMDDFAAKPGSPNAYGLLGGEFNKVEPQKRMLSSMTPVIVLDESYQPLLVTGSPGGSRIITTVYQIIQNHLLFNMNVTESTLFPRFHHQWHPDKIFIEKGFSADTIAVLEKFGHTIEHSRTLGNTQTITRDKYGMRGFSDLRRGSGGVFGF